MRHLNLIFAGRTIKSSKWRQTGNMLSITSPAYIQGPIHWSFLPWCVLKYIYVEQSYLINSLLQDTDHIDSHHKFKLTENIHWLPSSAEDHLRKLRLIQRSAWSKFVYLQGSSMVFVVYRSINGLCGHPPKFECSPENYSQTLKIYHFIFL